MTPILFEPQRTRNGNRTCGAAALTMVYRSLGQSCEQAAIWQRVAEQVRPGVMATRTHRLALDACKQGFAAVTLQAEHPAKLLAYLNGGDVRVILNHRLDRDSHLGHYSVLLQFDGREVEIHDPHHGPNRIVPWHEFEELWGPNGVASEIVGKALVLVGDPPDELFSCPMCQREVPAELTCDRCGQVFPTGPRAGIACIAPDCRNRMWSRLFCPFCDWAKTCRK